MCERERDKEREREKERKREIERKKRDSERRGRTGSSTRLNTRYGRIHPSRVGITFLN